MTVGLAVSQVLKIYIGKILEMWAPYKGNIGTFDFITWNLCMIKHFINEIMWQATDPEEILAIYVVKGLALSLHEKLLALNKEQTT